jgi:hypothetical protein
MAGRADEPRRLERPVDLDPKSPAKTWPEHEPTYTVAIRPTAPANRMFAARQSSQLTINRVKVRERLSHLKRYRVFLTSGNDDRGTMPSCCALIHQSGVRITTALTVRASF